VKIAKFLPTKQRTFFVESELLNGTCNSPNEWHKKRSVYCETSNASSRPCNISLAVFPKSLKNLLNLRFNTDHALDIVSCLGLEMDADKRLKGVKRLIRGCDLVYYITQHSQWSTANISTYLLTVVQAHSGTKFAPNANAALRHVLLLFLKNSVPKTPTCKSDATWGHRGRVIDGCESPPTISFANFSVVDSFLREGSRH
jgi:hypothetical protein